MATISDYLNKLILQRNALADNLTAKGVDSSHDETLESLIPKVLNISGGGEVSLMTLGEWEASSKRNMGYVAVIRNDGSYSAGVLYNTDVAENVWFDNGVFTEEGFDPRFSSNYEFTFNNGNQTKSIALNSNNKIEIDFSQSAATTCSIRINTNPIDVTYLSKVIFNVDYILSPNLDSNKNGTSFAFCISPNNGTTVINGNWSPSGYNNFTKVSYIQNPDYASSYSGNAYMELDVSDLAGEMYFYICHIKAQPVVTTNHDYITINSILSSQS